VIPVNVANVTAVADVDKSYHFRQSESLHKQSKSWFFVKNWDGCKIRDSWIIPLGGSALGEQMCKLQR